MRKQNSSGTSSKPQDPGLWESVWRGLGYPWTVKNVWCNVIMLLFCFLFCFFSRISSCFFSFFSTVSNVAAGDRRGNKKNKTQRWMWTCYPARWLVSDEMLALMLRSATLAGSRRTTTVLENHPGVKTFPAPKSREAHCPQCTWCSAAFYWLMIDLWFQLGGKWTSCSVEASRCLAESRNITSATKPAL